MLIIHGADIHLGASPDVGEPWGKQRKQELWDSFGRLIEAAEQQKADLLLIAGDLFHRPPLLKELREVNALFESLTKTKVVLIAGNHDYIGSNSFYKKYEWAKNVAFLSSETISRVAFPELKVDVYGVSYHQKEWRDRIYDEVKPEKNEYYHILLAHGGDEKHLPYTRETLRNSGFDYIAFGHIHQPGMILEGRAAMAGSLEPLDHTDRSVHGYVRVEVKDGENRIALVPMACRLYRTLELPLTAEDTMRSIYARLQDKIKEEGAVHIYDVELTGKCHASLEIIEDQLKSAGNVRLISDHTEKEFDYDALKQCYRGSLLERYITSFDNCSTPLEREALSLGTAAILEVLES